MLLGAACGAECLGLSKASIQGFGLRTGPEPESSQPHKSSSGSTGNIPIPNLKSRSSVHCFGVGASRSPGCVFVDYAWDSACQSSGTEAYSMERPVLILSVTAVARGVQKTVSSGFTQNHFLRTRGLCNQTFGVLEYVHVCSWL